MAIGERIKQARLSSGLSQRDLAEKVGISAQAISKYERELDTPSSGVLIRIAKALGLKMEYFFRSSTVVVKVAAYRKQHSFAKKKEAMVIGQITEWLERYLEVEALFYTDTPHTFTLPEGINYRINSVDEAERVAEELRTAWGLGFDPIDNLTELLEEKGIKVGFVDGDSKFDGCTFEAQNFGPVIVINSNSSGDRQRFNLAHELGHIVLQMDENIDHEKAAHRFAGAFLVPAASARQELGKKRTTISLYELHLLKHKYGLSMQGWIYRAKDLGILSETAAIRLFKKFRFSGWHKREPGDVLPPEKPKRLERMVMRALTEGIITESRAAELLNKSLTQFTREVAEEHEGLSCY